MWYRTFLPTLLLIGSAVLSTGGAYAGEQDWSVGEVGKASTLFCGHQDDIEGILAATLQGGHDAGVKVAQKLAAETLDTGMPKCIYMPLQFQVVKLISTFKSVEFPERGQPEDIYVIEVAPPSGDGLHLFMASWWPIVEPGEGT